MCVCLVGLSVGFSVFMLGHAQFHRCPSPASSLGTVGLHLRFLRILLWLAPTNFGLPYRIGRHRRLLYEDGGRRID